MPPPLTFNEYAAVRRRRGDAHQRAASEDAAEPRRDDATPPPEKRQRAPPLFNTARERIGIFLQGQECQVFVLVLTAVDISCALVQIYAAAGAISPPAWFAHALRFLEYQSVFTVLVFVMEALLLLFAFGATLFSHLGYTLDCLVAVVTLGYRVTSDVRVVSLFGFVRVWRIVRLVNRAVASHEEGAQAAREALLIEQECARQALEDKSSAEERLQREIGSRKRVEEMLKTYKDEVETLREALHIAAQSIAEAGGGAGPDIDVGQLGGGLAIPGGSPRFVVAKDGSYDGGGQEDL